MKKGLFISIEGGEGVGKSTALSALTSYLSSVNVKFTLTREPGGTPIAEEVREILLKKHDDPMDPDTELLLMFAARVQNVSQVIKPALSTGQWVISDRFFDATFAYQGGGRGIDMQRIKQLSDWALDGLQPDITILLDAPVEIGYSRIQGRATKDRIESEGLEFLRRVRDAYLRRAERNPKRFCIINADQEITVVHQQMIDIIKPYIVNESC